MASNLTANRVLKPMRRGTRSCLECRRRKIKCKYATDQDVQCIPCHAFDRVCQKQGYVVDQSLRTRVARVQTEVERLGRNQVTLPGDAALSPSKTSDVVDTVVDTHRPRTAVPPSDFNLIGYLGDFTDDKVRPVSQPDNPPRVQRGTNQACIDDDRRKLLATIADEPQVLSLLDDTSSWWVGLRQQHWTLRKNARGQSLTDYVNGQLTSRDPMCVATALLCLVQSLFLVRRGIDDAGVKLSSSLDSITSRILNVISETVLDTDRYRDSEDVILLYLLRGKYYAESSHAHKGVLNIQQAVRLAQLQKLGVAEHNLTVSVEDLQTQQQFVGGVLEIERFMCMIFGYPYIQDAHFSDRVAADVLRSGTADATLQMRAFRRVTALAAERIVNRNAHNGGIDHDATLLIEQHLDWSQESLSPDFWDIEAHARSSDMYGSFEILMAHLWFRVTQMFCYLPYATSNAPYLSATSHVGSWYRRCLDAARELARVFLVLRNTPSQSVQMCNCDDFMGVLSGTILMIGRLRESSATCASDLDGMSTFVTDMELIDQLKDVCLYRATEQGGTIAKQGLFALEALTSFFEEDCGHDEEHFLANQFLASNISGGDDAAVEQNDKDEMATTRSVPINLPYFGVITVYSSRKPQSRRHHHTKQSKYGEQMSNMAAKPNTLAPSTAIISHDHLLPASSSNTTPQSSQDARESRGSQQSHPSSITSSSSPPDTNTNTNPGPETDMISWEDWNQFTFDQELNQDWNDAVWSWDLDAATAAAAADMNTVLDM